jgi:4-hydroxybenzoate polyprenyltransferase
MPAAWAFLGAQLSAGLALLLTLPPDTIALGCAIVPVVGLYPALKRVTYLPQVVLGLAMNWGAVMGWAAVHGGGIAGIASGGAAALYGGAVLWTVVYDTIYAHQE